jgi:enoyl-CoA hydratase/3-hydroxyacyl-CoA dehydrogenase
MSSTDSRPFRKLAVIGAGNMGSGIAQKMATEGFAVVLVDLDDDKVRRGLDGIATTLEQGVERRIFRPEQAEEIRGRIEGTADWSRLGDVDLVVEAVFEDAGVKREVFRRLEEVCPAETILGTNTSSFSVTDLADGADRPERIVGLHYFYHPAKNRLVEVVPGAKTDPDALARAWALQEQIGKTPIASADASGFVVNRYFVPWLNEAVRLLEEGAADIPTIEAASTKTFGVGMGPFELMNVTGVPIAMHAANTLGEAFGPFYAPARTLVEQVEGGKPWDLSGEPDPSRFDEVGARLAGGVFYVAAQLVDEGVATIEDTDIGARVGLRWPRGPFEMMNRIGIEAARAQVAPILERWNLTEPATLAGRTEPFTFRLVRSETVDGIATLTLNRPDAMNALNETVVGQLHEAFRAAADDPAVRGIVIAGAGKGFIAGADIRFFVRNIQANALDRIVSFTETGHELLNAIETCPKPVVARMHGLALGGGLELALACDRIVASDKAVLAFPETGIGIYPGLGGTQRTTRRVGVGLAKYLVLTGQMMSAAKAAAIGLVDACVPHDRLDDAVREAIEAGPVSDRTPQDPPAAFRALADLFGEASADALLAGEVDAGDDPVAVKAVGRVRAKAPVAVRLATRLIEEGAGLPLADGLRMELDHLREIFSTRDALAGLRSVGGKPPAYEGR